MAVFERIRIGLDFGAALRMLYHHLAYCGVGLSQFKEFAESTTVKIKSGGVSSRGHRRPALEISG